MSIDLRVGSGAFAGAPELRDLILQQQQAVQQRLGRRRTSRDVHVHWNDPVHALDDVIAVPERDRRSSRTSPSTPPTSGPASGRRCASSIGAILMVTVPDTTIRSECRGEAHGTMPRRSTSKRDANVAIISMAQQARPNVTGHTDDLRAQLRNASARRRDDEAAGKAVDALGDGLEQPPSACRPRAASDGAAPTPEGL